MFKLIALFAVLALTAAAPAPGAVLLSSPAVVSPVLHPVSPVVHRVVSPAVTSYSSYSSGVVHGSPVVSVPVVHQPVVHTLPLTNVVHPVFI